MAESTTVRDRAEAAYETIEPIVLFVAGCATGAAEKVKDCVVDTVSGAEFGAKLKTVRRQAGLTVRSIDYEAGLDAVRNVGDWLTDRKDDVESAILDATTLTQRRVAAGVIVTGAATAATVLVIRRRQS